MICVLNNISTYLRDLDYRVTLLKNGLHVLNYKSIIDITSNIIMFKVNDKLFKVNGKNMILKELDKKEFLITGVIESVTING